MWRSGGLPRALPPKRLAPISSITATLRHRGQVVDGGNLSAVVQQLHHAGEVVMAVPFVGMMVRRW
jgi:hypothetical protein